VDTLSAEEQDSIGISVSILQDKGPELGRPHVDTLKGSKFSNLKELRTQHQGRPFRTIFAFNPLRTAILLIGGDKTGDQQFYRRIIPIAEQLYAAHLQEIKGG